METEQNLKILRQNTNYQPGNNSTIQKHIDYLGIIEKILETKVTKDVKIMNLSKFYE